MTGNTSILQNNVLHCIESTEGSRAFLWASEVTLNDRFLHKAEANAREVDYLVSTLSVLIGLAAKSRKATKEVQSDLLAFMRVR